MYQEERGEKRDVCNLVEYTRKPVTGQGQEVSLNCGVEKALPRSATRCDGLPVRQAGSEPERRGKFIHFNTKSRERRRCWIFGVLFLFLFPYPCLPFSFFLFAFCVLCCHEFCVVVENHTETSNSSTQMWQCLLSNEQRQVWQRKK